MNVKTFPPTNKHTSVRRIIRKWAHRIAICYWELSDWLSGNRNMNMEIVLEMLYAVVSQCKNLANETFTSVNLPAHDLIRYEHEERSVSFEL